MSELFEAILALVIGVAIGAACVILLILAVQAAGTCA
jgi:hypothetical protein